MPLPDIDLGSWLDYQRQQTQDAIDSKLKTFSLGQSIDQRLSELHSIGQDAEAPAPPPPQPEPPPPPQPAPPPEPEPSQVPDYQPPPELAPEPEPQAVASPQPRAATTEYSPAPQASPPSQPPEADPFSTWRRQVFAGGLNAIEQAGGNVQAFASSLSENLGTSNDPRQAYASALNAAEAAGGNVQAFASRLQLPDPPRPSPPPQFPPGGGGSGGFGGPANAQPSTAEVRDYIAQAAAERGIDPTIALKVANSEGGMEAARRGTFKTGSSWWPFQLHYGGQGYEQLGDTAGMGNQFTAKTGYQPGDPSAWQAATDYALDQAKQGGWGAWYGAKAQGITGFMGINENAPGVPGLVGKAVSAVKGTFKDVSQFGSSELTSDEAYAACGPAAAVRFAQRFGRNPSLKEALDLAKTVGWTAAQGMAGIASQQKLMQKMGIDTELVGPAQQQRMALEASTGNPVTISTQDHYFYADSYNPQTGQFHVGRSGTDLRGGKEWMSMEQMTSLMGPVQGALLANNPVVPGGTTAEAPSLLDRIGGMFSDAGTAAKSASDAVAKRIDDTLADMESARAESHRNLMQGTQDFAKSVADSTGQTANTVQTGAQGMQARLDALGLGGGPGQAAQNLAGWADLKPPSETVQRQWAGEEDAQLGPVTIPGRLAAPFGLIGENQKTGPGVYGGREAAGLEALRTPGTSAYDPEYGALYQEQQQLQARATDQAQRTGYGFEPGSPEEQRMFDIQQRMAELTQGRNLQEAAKQNPNLEAYETAGQIAQSIPSMALLPGAVSRTPLGIAGALGSIALDPSSAPFVGFGEGAELLGRGLGRVLKGADGTVARLVGEGQLAPDAAKAVDVVDDAGQELPVAKFPELHKNITGVVSDAVNRAIEGAVHTPEELADAQRTIDSATGSSPLNPFPQLQTAEGLATVRKQLNALADMGAEQRFWYDDSSREIMRAVQGNKEDGEKIAQLVAIYSNNTPVNENMNNAMTAWTQFKRGEPINAPTLSRLNRSADALLYGGKDWEGAKTNNFYRNLMKNIDNDKYVEMGLADGQTGATIDVWMMRALNSLRKSPAAGKTAGQYEFAAREVAKIAAERGWTPEQAQAAIWVATKAGWENKVRKVPMDLSAEGIFHYGTALENRVAQSNLGGMVGGAEDVYARELGLLGSDGRISLPKARATSEGKPVLGAAAEGAVDATARRAMNAYVAAHGIEKQLPEVYWAREIGDARNLDVANGIVASAGRRLDDAEIKELQTGLDSLMGPGQARAIPSETGAWVLNTGSGPNKAFHTATKRAIKGLQYEGEILTAERRFDSEFLANDWSTQANGEGYRSAVQLAGGGFPERFEEISRGLGRSGGNAGPGAGSGGRAAARDYGSEPISAPELRGAGVSTGGLPDTIAGIVDRGAAPLRSSVGRGAVQGAVAGGYQAAQEEGATPQDVALGALGGSVLGGVSGALGRRGAGRTAGRIARIAEEVSPGARERAEASARRLEQSARDDFRSGRIDAEEYQNRFADAKALREGQAAAAPAAEAGSIEARRAELQAEKAQALDDLNEWPREVGQARTRGRQRAEENVARINEQLYQLDDEAKAARVVDNTRPAASIDEAVQDAARVAPPPLDDTGRLNPRPSTAEQMLDVVGARVGTTPRGERVFQGALPGFHAPGSEAMEEVTQAVADRLPNLANLEQGNEDIRSVLIANAATISPEQIDMYKRGTIKWDELIDDLAGRFGMTKEQYLATKPGQAFNEAELLALRSTVVNEARKEAEMMLDFGKRGVENLTDDEKLAGITQILDTGRLQAVGTGAASTAGRTLNQQKIRVTQEMARTITGQVEQRAAAKLAAQAKRDAAAAAKKAEELEKKIAATKAAQAEREAKRAEIKGETEMLRAESKAAKAAKEAERKTAAQNIKDWEEALRKVRQDQAGFDRAAAMADKRAAREAARQEKVHEHLMGRAREALGALAPEKITDQILDDYIKLHQSKDPLAIGKFLKGMQNVGWWDRTNILRYAGMLSSTFTHGTQALSNLIQLGLIPATHPFAVGADVIAQRLGGGERTRYMGELPQMMRGASAGFKEGLAEAAEVMRSGINVRSMAQDLESITKTGKAGLRQADFGMEKTRLGQAIGQKASYGVNAAIESPLRAMQASDLMFRGAARGMHTRQLAARKALGEGHSGKAVGDRVEEIMGNLEDHLDIVNEADKMAKRAVLQEESWVMKLPRTGPAGTAMSLAVPFLRTPYNIAAQGVGMTPAGFASAVMAARRGERGEAVDRAARATLGTAVMGGAFLLLGDEHLTGAYPSDDAEKSTLPPGWRPWSFRVVKPGGEAVYVPIAFLGPLSVPFALAAAAGEARKQGKPVDKWAPQMAGSVGRFMADQAMLMGFNNAINTIIEPDRYAEQWLEQTVTQFAPYSGLQRQISQILDRPSRDPDNVIEALLAANVPTQEMVRPRLDRLGNEVRTGQSGIGAVVSPLRYGTGTDNETLRTLRAADVNLPDAPKTYRNMALTTDEQREFKQLAGQNIQDAVERASSNPKFADADLETRRTVLQRVVEAARNQAFGEMVQRWDKAEIRDRIDKEKERKQPLPVAR